MNEFGEGVLVGFLVGGLVMFLTCAAWALWAMAPNRKQEEDEHARI